MIKRAYSRDLFRDTQVVENSDGTFTPTVALTGNILERIEITDDIGNVNAGSTLTLTNTSLGVDLKEFKYFAIWARSFDGGFESIRVTNGADISDNTFISYLEEEVFSIGPLDETFILTIKKEIISDAFAIRMRTTSEEDYSCRRAFIYLWRR